MTKMTNCRTPSVQEVANLLIKTLGTAQMHQTKTRCPKSEAQLCVTCCQQDHAHILHTCTLRRRAPCVLVPMVLLQGWTITCSL